MFPQFGATAESLSKASSLVLRIGTDAHLYDDPDDVSIAPLLDSKFDSERSEALKRLLALIAQGADVSNFFPQVVKNVASQSLEVKKLVYLYLLHYAEKRPNEALLSINCFQKDLSDTNPLVRAWALRAMAGIRLHVVAPLVLVAIRKCSRDPSAYVRKCAANALPKLYDLHQLEDSSAIEELVSILLSDHSPGVVGAAASAFNSICPKNLSLIGKEFRRLCETLPDIEEWGQIVLMEILLRYVVAKHGLVKESIICTPSSNLTSQSDGISTALNRISDDDHDFSPEEASKIKLNALMFRCYFQGQEEYLSQSGCTDEDYDLDSSMSTSSQNNDVKIFLQCTLPLLWSQNSAVVLNAAGVHWILAPREEVQKIVKPLLFLLRSSPASKYVILCNIQVFVKVIPALFAPYFEDFFVCTSDPFQIRALKLDILSAVATDSSIAMIFEEFQDYIKDPDRRFVADTVAALGLCALKLPSVASTCLEGLIALTVQESHICNESHMDGEGGILVQAIMSIKAIIKQNPAACEKVIVLLVRNLDVVKMSVARALIVWIVGEYSSIGKIVPKIVPTVLKYLAWSFTSEEIETKLQVLNTTAKVVVSAEEEELNSFRKILSYILELAKCDKSYDIRDRARIIEKLVPCHLSFSQEDGAYCLSPDEGMHHEFVEHIIRGKEQTTPNLVDHLRFYLPGSLSQIVLHAAPGYGPLPKPCSLPVDDHYHSYEMADGRFPADKRNKKDAFRMRDPAASSGPSTEESVSDYDSQCSDISSYESEGSGVASDSYDNGKHASLPDKHATEIERGIPLVSLCDVGVDGEQSSEGHNHTSFSSNLAELMSESALESWLDEQPSTLSVQKSGQVTAARLSINDIGLSIQRKVHTVLDPAIVNGLKVEYTFSSETSAISPLMVCIEMLFGNYSTEPLTGISIENEVHDESGQSANMLVENSESPLTTNDTPTILHMEEIASLDPGHTIKKILQVRFHHHLLPLELAVFCNGKKHLIKLWPEIGYFLRPFPLDMDAFFLKESQMRGMFECTKRLTYSGHLEELKHEDKVPSNIDKFLVVARSLASKLLSNANVQIVSVDMPVSTFVDDASGLCLRFSGEVLSSSNSCLITIMAEGKCYEPLDVSVKVNCEDTIFGPNQLNRIVAFLQ